MYLHLIQLLFLWSNTFLSLTLHQHHRCKHCPWSFTSSSYSAIATSITDVLKLPIVSIWISSDQLFTSVCTSVLALRDVAVYILNPPYYNLGIIWHNSAQFGGISDNPILSITMSTTRLMVNGEFELSQNSILCLFVP